MTRDDVVRVARSFLDVPFHHMGRSRAGMDCAGLLICVARELGFVPQDFDVPNYLPTPDGSMMGLCGLHMTHVDKMQAGDCVVVAMDKEPQHLGILTDYRHGGFAIVHACNSRSCVPPRVIETRLMFSRAMKYVAAFKFPGI